MENEIYLYGTVGSYFWDEDYFTAAGVREMLVGRTGPLTVRINSGGGVASEGQAIYTILRDYPDQVAVIIDGIAASAASLIAMAGDTITMRLGSLLMIHDPANPWIEGRGTEQDHLNAAKGLGVVSKAYAAVYAARAKITTEAAREIMRAETYYEGEAALAAGFATAVDGDEEAEAVARFDYRIYGHAPAGLLKAGADITRRKTRMAVMAMMVGADAPKQKEANMEDDDVEAVVTADADVAEVTAAEDGNEDPVDPAVEESTDDEEAAQPAAAQILEVAETLGRPMAETRDQIARGLTFSAAVMEMHNNIRKEKPVTGKPRLGGPTARIVRDERSTRRTAMSAALMAQITGTQKPAEIAKPYMGMSLVEMAAECVGHRGPIRNAGQKVEVFMQASHSTSDFPGIFENALNKVLLERYESAEPTYRLISRRRDFKDFRAHPQVRSGDFPKLQPIGQGGEIKFGTFGESREQAILSSYAVGLRITRQMMINDDLGAIDELLSDYGQMVADFEEETFYAFALTAALADTKTVFHADHNNLAGAGAAITVNAVAAGRAAIRKQTSIDGKKLNMSPSIILVGPDKETEAEQLVAQVQPNVSTSVNPFSGKLTPVVTAQITGNAWYLLAGADRPGGALWVHGFLEGQGAPRIRTEETFGTQGMAMTVEHDFGLGAVDFRGGWKNPGA